MATQTLGTVNNEYELKLLKAGLTEPLTTYLADPLDPERVAAGFPVVLAAADASALETAYPAASYPAAFAKVGAAAPFALYFSTGVATTGWKAVTIAA
jgi:hypothetical protein